jgi:LmbE family N-acetylglucosaminyl deacetylase
MREPETPTLEELTRAERVLCVQPHYDDNDIAAGGTIALLANTNVEVVYLTVTDDLAGVLDPNLPDEEAVQQLKEEARQAGKIIGVKDHLWLNHPDAGSYAYQTMRRSVLQSIRKLRPNFIFTCDPWLHYEAHQDHILTGMAVAEASLFYNLPRIPSDPETDSGYDPYALRGVLFYWTNHPNLKVDVSRFMQKKSQALNCYRTQFSPEDLVALQETVRDDNHRTGESMSCEFAEEFKIVVPDQLHINTRTWR